MSRIPQSTEASAPAEPETLAEWPESLPEPERDGLTRDAVDVHVEREPRKVRRPKCPRAPRREQLSLFGEGAPGAGDDEGDARRPCSVDELERYGLQGAIELTE